MGDACGFNNRQPQWRFRNPGHDYAFWPFDSGLAPVVLEARPKDTLAAVSTNNTHKIHAQDIPRHTQAANRANDVGAHARYPNTEVALRVLLVWPPAELKPYICL